MEIVNNCSKNKDFWQFCLTSTKLNICAITNYGIYRPVVLNTHWYWRIGLSDSLKTDNVLSISGEEFCHIGEKGGIITALNTERGSSYIIYNTLFTSLFTH
jgi:hypothetical protein